MKNNNYNIYAGLGNVCDSRERQHKKKVYLTLVK